MRLPERLQFTSQEKEGFIAQKACDAEPYLTSPASGGFGMTGWGEPLGLATIPPLRGPTRHSSARKRRSGRSGRDDKFGLDETKKGGDTEATRSRMTNLWNFSMTLDGLDEAGEDGYGDGNVAGGDEYGEKLREALQPGGVDGVAEAERLKHAPQAVIEVIAKHDHGDDVEERDGPDLEAGDHVVIDIVFVEGAAGVHGAESKMQKMENQESENDGPAPQHGAGSVGGIEIGLLDVVDGPGRTLQEPELERRPDVQADGKEQGDPRAPQEGGEGLQRRRVVIDFFGRQEDLQIAEQVAANETEQHEAGDGHYRFLADGGLPEMQAASRKVYHGSAHGM